MSDLEASMRPTVDVANSTDHVSRHPEISSTAAWYALTVFIAATMLASIDTQLLVLLTDPIKGSFHLSDTQIGLLQGAGLVLIAGLASVPVGWLADRFDRRIILGLCVVAWSIAAAACGLADAYPAFVIAAVGLGIGKAGVTPVVWGLIPEVFRENQRVLANNVYAFVSLLGAGLGVGLAGVLLDALDRIRPQLPAALIERDLWRLAFFSVAAIGPPVALLMIGVRKRPSPAKIVDRQLREPRQSVTAYVRLEFRTLAGVFGALGFEGVGVGAIQTWLPVAAVRDFHASAASVGRGMGLSIIAATLIGTGLGTFVVRRMRRRLGTGTPMRLIGNGLVLSAIGAVGLPFVISDWQLYVLFFIVTVPLVMATILLPTLVQDVSPPSLRSQVTAVGVVFATLITATSPVLVGAVSDVLTMFSNALMIAVSVVSVAGMGIGAVLARTCERSFVRTVEGLQHAQRFANA